MNIPFIGGGVNSKRALQSDSQYLLNFYVEINRSGSKSSAKLIGTPGLDLFVSLSLISGVCRGFFVSSAGKLYCVIHNLFIELEASRGYTELGTLSSFTGIVKFAENVNITNNTTQIMIVDNSSGFIYNTSTGAFTKITSAGYIAGTHVVYKSGLFIQNKKNTNQFIFSNLYNGLTWSALDYYAAEGNSDNVIALETINNDIWLFGSKSIEAYYPTGVSSSPFASTPNSYSDIGLAAVYSLAKINNTLFWLGEGREGNNQIYMLKEYTPQKISDSNIEYFLNSLTTKSTATAFCYQQEGHVFYMLSFPDEDKTICYDATTGIWHERGYYNSNTGNYNIHRAVCAEYFNNKVIVGDYANSNIYYLDLDTYTDNGNPIQRICQSPHIFQDRKRINFKSFELDIEAGQGLVSGQGSEPLVMMQYSNDGGNTWSDEYLKSAGKIGEYKNRVRFTRLGQARDRVFKIKVSDPIKWIINSAYADIELIED